MNYLFISGGQIFEFEAYSERNPVIESNRVVKNIDKNIKNNNNNNNDHDNNNYNEINENNSSIKEQVSSVSSNAPINCDKKNISKKKEIFHVFSCTHKITKSLNDALHYTMIVIKVFNPDIIFIEDHLEYFNVIDREIKKHKVKARVFMLVLTKKLMSEHKLKNDSSWKEITINLLPLLITKIHSNEYGNVENGHTNDHSSNMIST
jgi:hypothetical protein